MTDVDGLGNRPEVTAQVDGADGDIERKRLLIIGCTVIPYLGDAAMIYTDVAVEEPKSRRHVTAQKLEAVAHLLGRRSVILGGLDAD